jgi:hypothetical protein
MSGKFRDWMYYRQYMTILPVLFLTVIHDLYKGVLQCLRGSIQHRRPELRITGKWLLLQENAPPQTATIWKRICDSTSNHCIAAFTISPNLPPCEIFLIPILKRALKGYRSVNIQAVQTAVTEQLWKITGIFFFSRLLRRPPEVKESVYWSRQKLLAPDCKYAVLIFKPSVSEISSRIFK